MITVKFNPNGGVLTAKAVFLGDMVADYGMYLKQSNSNSQTTLLEGDNLNPENDTAQLPTPVNSNDGRRLKLETGFVGNHPNINKNYEIRLDVFQDEVLIGTNVDKSDATTELTGKAQYSLLLINLVTK